MPSIDIRILMRAAMVGALVHIAVVVLAAIFPSAAGMIGPRAAMFGVMMISGTAGLLYARDFDKGYSAGALGGLLAGLISAFAGLALAIALDTRQVFPLGLGSVIGTAIGGIGGIFGQMSANLRKLTENR